MGLKENTFGILFESIQEGLIVVNDKGVIELCNQVCEKLFGYKVADLVGQKIEILIPHASKQRHVNLREDYNHKPAQRSMGSNLKLCGLHKNGHEIPVEVSLNPFFADGQSYVVALVADVSIRREAEIALINMTENLEEKVRERTAELKQSEALYKSIARNFPGGVISIFDQDLKYLFAEGQGLYELGIETEDLIGLDYLSRLDAETRAVVEPNLKDVFQGKGCSFEIQVNDGFYLLNSVPLINDQGIIDRILVVEKNITTQKRAAEKLRESLEAEKELNEMKSRFVSMASHEFRTPLTTINSSANLIQRYHEKQRYDATPKHVNRIKGAVRNLTNILNDFLSLEKLESGNINVTKVKFNLSNLLFDVIEEVEGLKKNEQNIVVDIKSDLWVFSDPQLIKNVFLNLLSNALKYSHDDGKIIVKVEEKFNEMSFLVQDFGIGIPVHEQEKLFTRFFRAENVVNIEGTGLGLNIVAKYVDLLQGNINFESKQNVGTSFYVNLPMQINEIDVNH